VEDLREVVGVVAEWALDLQAGNRSVLKLLGSFSLHDGVSNGVIVTLLCISGVVFVLLAVCTKALCYEINFNSLDVLNQSCNGRE